MSDSRDFTVTDALEICRPEDLGPNRLLLFSLERDLQFRTATRLHLDLHWPREIAPGRLIAAIGEAIGPVLEAVLHATVSGSFSCAVSLDDDDRLRLRIVERNEPGAELASTLRVEPSAVTVLPWNPEPLLRKIVAAAGPEVRDAAARLAESIPVQAVRALEDKLAASLAWRCRRTACSTALIDCSFEFSSAGLSAFRAALGGDFSAVLGAPDGSVIIHEAELTETFAREHSVELHLPFFDRKQWLSRSEAFAGLKVQSGASGRLFAYTVSGFDHPRERTTGEAMLALAGALLSPEKTGTFELTSSGTFEGDAAHLGRITAPALIAAYDFPPAATRALADAASAGGPLQIALTLGIPAALASQWFHSPAERDPDFFDIYSQVSVALQQALRRWIPAVYLNSFERYEELQAAYTMLFYRGLRPCSGRPRSEFAYELVTPERPGVARASNVRPLATELGNAHRLLADAGQDQLKKLYAAWRAPAILEQIAARPRRINALLSADAFLIDHFVQLGLKLRELPAQAASHPEKTARRLATILTKFSAGLHNRLRHVYPGHDYSPLGSLLLVEATRALGAALGHPEPVAATLRLSSPAGKQVFVNSAFRPR